MDRLTQYTFLPKQKDSDNRVIPHQLYAYELDQILDHASNYLTMLGKADADGITNADKIRAILPLQNSVLCRPVESKLSLCMAEAEA